MFDKIYNYLKKTIDEVYEDKINSESWAYWLDLENGYSVMLAWEEGFDENDSYDGYCLCASIRVTNSSYFSWDWDIVEESTSIFKKYTNKEIHDIAGYLLSIVECKIKEGMLK